MVVTMTKEAFTGQVLDAEKKMYCIAKSILHQDEDCADAIQNTILDAYSKLSYLREEKYFQSWLIRILINNCYDLLKERRKYMPYEEYLEQGSSDFSIHDLDLAEAIDALDEKSRIPCVLHYINGYSVKEISSLLQISESAVKMRIHRAKKKLREYLREE